MKMTPELKLRVLSVALLAALGLAVAPGPARSQDATGHEGHVMSEAQGGGHEGHVMPGTAPAAEAGEAGATAAAADASAANPGRDLLGEAPATSAAGPVAMSDKDDAGGMGCSKGKCAMRGKKGKGGGGHEGHGGGGGGGHDGHGGDGGDGGGHGKMSHGGGKGGGHGDGDGGHGKGGGHGKDGGPQMYGEAWKASLTAVQKAELDRLHLELARVKAPMKAMAKALEVQIAVLSTSPQPQLEALEAAISQRLDAEREILRAQARYVAAQRAVLTPEQQVSFDLHTIHGAMHGQDGKGHGGGH